MCAAMTFHGFPLKFVGYLAITALYDEVFQDVPYVIQSPP
jgi:hypothetical protein